MKEAKQAKLGLVESTNQKNVEEYRFEPIKGFPMLNWRGKRPFTSTRYYPAQLKEIHGTEKVGWRNKIYWGDNLQVMSHLLKEYRGKIQLVYIDPPFDSKAEYKKKVSVRDKIAENDRSAIEEKQYNDIWINDEYLQFMYERLVLIRELMTETGSIWLHCDWRKSHHLRMILDEIFGPQCFKAHVVWRSMTSSGFKGKTSIGKSHDDLLYYSKTPDRFTYNSVVIPYDESYLKERFNKVDENGRKFKDEKIGTATTAERIKQLKDEGRIYITSTGTKRIKHYLDEAEGYPADDVWTDIFGENSQSHAQTGYPTQKPNALLRRILNMTSNPGDLIFDCFMGSGTTQAVALELGRRFIGADINLGAVQISTKRLLSVAEELEVNAGQGELFSEKEENAPEIFYTGFEVYDVNHYDVFRNPVEARGLLLEALEVNKLPQSQLFDGEKDGRMIKIMPVNRIATRADLGELIAGLDLKAFDKRYKRSPNEPVEKITLVCMGHEPDLKATLEKEVEPYRLDVEVVDILRDRQDLLFKRDSEAKVIIKNGKLVIERFYPMNLLSKLSLQKGKLKDWRELVECVMIDWNYDGAVLTPTTVDIPEKDEMVSGSYSVPKDAGTVRVKITDLLSESLEVELVHG